MAGRVVLLCGRSFSGKSTIAGALSRALPGSTVISLDGINEGRGLHGGQGIPIEEWARTNEVARERAAAVLRGNGTAIIDDTSSPRFLRDGWRELCRDRDARLVLVFIDAAPETIVKRQTANRVVQNRSDVTDRVMHEHLDSFQTPAEDENALRFPAETLSPAQVVAAVAAALSGTRGG